MEMKKKHDILEQKLCKELELIANRYENSTGEMAVGDVDKVDKIYHALKSLATYRAMEEAEEDYGFEAEGMSGRRGRNPMNGRYVSRSMMPSWEDGYSGHYPPYPPMSGYPRY